MQAQANKPLGIVIPAHGHPAFLAEAIVSACEQECTQPVKVVVVDDGCRFPETGQVAFAMQQEYPEKLFYFRQKNERLPAARNAGVKFLLALDPDLDAIFFLDADNRIEPYALQNYRKALGEDETIGWAYPDISFFGLSWSNNGFEIRETSSEYSELKHLAGNISEAGSMVRADIFRRGVFFDETMRSGLEDWDFWLSALEAGYKGVRAEQSGFLYRRRPESMLSASQRVVSNLQQRIRTKHSALYAPAHVMRLEHSEDPVFAIHIAGESTVRLTSDPLLEGMVLSLLEFKEKLQARLQNELEHFFPDYFILLTPEEAHKWKSFEKHLRWCFWVMKQTAFDVCQLNIRVGSQIGYSLETSMDDTQPNALVVSQGHLKALTRRLLPETELSCAPNSLLSLHLPVVMTDAENAAEEGMRDTMVNLPDALNAFANSMHEETYQSAHRDRQYSGPAPLIIRKNLVDSICGDVESRPYTACSDKPRDTFIFSVDALRGGRLFKVTELLQKNKEQGRENSCLFECKVRQVDNQNAPAGWNMLVDDVAFCLLPQNMTEARCYLGYEISVKLAPPQVATISVFARTSERVFLVGGVAAIEAAGDIRQYGAKVTVLHVQPETNTDKELAKYLAYEHVIDQIIVSSEDTVAQMAGLGFPVKKIMTWRDFKNA